MPTYDDANTTYDEATVTYDDAGAGGSEVSAVPFQSGIKVGPSATLAGAAYGLALQESPDEPGSTPSSGGVLYVIDDILKLKTADGNTHQIVPSTTSGAPATADYVTLSSQAALSGEAVLGSSVIMVSSAAQIPAAGIAGRLVLVTDDLGGTFYRDNGTTWVQAGAGVNVWQTLPAVVNHGATASTARPDTSAAVIWVGSVEPTNALDNDIWLDT